MYPFLKVVKTWVEYISRQLSLVGGFIMISLALITVISIFGRTLFCTSIEGDY
jgi:TRAP-type C4-dicarboxylate transport system permease small subunit